MKDQCSTRQPDIVCINKAKHFWRYYYAQVELTDNEGNKYWEAEFSPQIGQPDVVSIDMPDKSAFYLK